MDFLGVSFSPSGARQYITATQYDPILGNHVVNSKWNLSLVEVFSSKNTKRIDLGAIRTHIHTMEKNPEMFLFFPLEFFKVPSS